MVAINATLFVVLGMFIVFLWAMNVLVFRPLLALIDEREDQMKQDKESAAADLQESEVLERQYQRQLARQHRTANAQVLQALRETQREHQEKVQLLRQREDEAVRATRREAELRLAEQRKQFGPLSDDLARAIVRQLCRELD